MADPTSVSGKPRASDPVACYGIVFVAEPAAQPCELMRAPALSLPQLASPGLDAGFLTNCLRALHGGKLPIDPEELAVKRLAGTRGREASAVHLYSCSRQLRDLLCLLGERRAREIAINWQALTETAAAGERRSAPLRRQGPLRERRLAAATRLDGRTLLRITLLAELVGLARRAKAEERILMLRVEYHRRRPR